MRISELIAELGEVLAERGDIEVMVRDPGYGAQPFQRMFMGEYQGYDEPLRACLVIM